jgi:hypothetical protein
MECFAVYEAVCTHVRLCVCLFLCVYVCEYVQIYQRHKGTECFVTKLIVE